MGEVDNIDKAEDFLDSISLDDMTNILLRYNNTRAHNVRYALKWTYIDLDYEVIQIEDARGT